jgi:hypothetical protein
MSSVPYRYNQKDVIASLVERFAFDGRLKSVRRGDSGKELYCVGIDGEGRKTLFILSGTSNRSIPCPGTIVFANGQQEIVAWTDDYKQGVHFRSGQVLTLPPHALFDVDPSGQYFIIGEKPSSTWLGRTASPETRVCISTNLLGGQVFVKNEEIFVTGWSFQTAGEKINQVTTCLIIGRREAEYKVSRQVQFPWAAAVVDVDPYSKAFLLSSKSDMFPSLFAFDEQSGKKTKVGGMTDYAFFLTSDLLLKSSKR